MMRSHVLMGIVWLAVAGCIGREPPTPPPPTPVVDTCLLQSDLTVEPLFSCSKDWVSSGATGVWSCVPGAADTLQGAIGMGYWEALPTGAKLEADGKLVEATLRSAEVLVPQSSRAFLMLRHAFSFLANGGSVVEVEANGQAMPVEPVSGYPGKILAPGTSLDGQLGFVAGSSQKPWQTDAFDLRPWVGTRVRFVFHVALPNSTQGPPAWRIDQLAVVGGRPCSQATPVGILRAEAQATASALESSHRSAVDAALEKMQPEQRRAFVDRMLWFGVDPVAIGTRPWIRGAFGHVTAQGMAYDPAPSLSFSDLEGRARQFLAALGGSLFGLSRASGDLWPTAPNKLGSAGEIRYQQVFAGYPVEEAFLQVSFDNSGRINSASSAYVPQLRTYLVPTVPQPIAEKAAMRYLVDAPPPLWSNALPTVEDTTLVAVNGVALGGDMADHLAYRVTVANQTGLGRQNVWVDANDATIIGSAEQTALLSANDVITEVRGDVAGPADIDWGPLDPWGSLDWKIWDGAPGGGPFGGTCYRPELCATVDAQRIMRGTALLHGLMSERGGEAAPDTAVFPNDPYWTWPDLTTMTVGIGARGVGSIGANLGGDRSPDGKIAAASGTAVEDLFGHEYGHSLTGGAADFVRYGVPRPAVDGDAIEEHIGDVLGVMVKARSPIAEPGTDIFVMADESDAQAAIGMVTHAAKPCTWSDVPRFWRSVRDPSARNGGWCEGATHLLEQNFNAYDAFGFAYLAETSAGPGGLPGCIGERNDDSMRQYADDHTSLGVGNRFA